MSKSELSETQKQKIQLENNEKLESITLAIDKKFTITTKNITNLNIVNGYCVEISCIICNNIPADVFVCDKCYNIYCRNCIDKDGRKCKTCYSDDRHPFIFTRNTTRPSRILICEDEDVAEVFGSNSNRKRQFEVKVPLIEALFNKIQIHCKYQELGCQALINYGQINEHEWVECDYTILDCENHGCIAKVYRKDLIDHLKICEYRLVLCQYCEKYIYFCRIQQHLLKCQKRPVQCEWCEETYKFFELEGHQARCLKKLITCSHCFSKIIREDLSIHSGEVCQKKQRNYYQRQFFREKSKSEKLETQSNEKEQQILKLQQDLQKLLLASQEKEQKMSQRGDRTTSDKQKKEERRSTRRQQPQA